MHEGYVGDCRDDSIEVCVGVCRWPNAANVDSLQVTVCSWKEGDALKREVDLFGGKVNGCERSRAEVTGGADPCGEKGG
jgi:hypothetical protein